MASKKRKNKFGKIALPLLLIFALFAIPLYLFYGAQELAKSMLGYGAGLAFALFVVYIIIGDTTLVK